VPRWSEVILIVALVTTVAAFFYGQRLGYAKAQARHAIETAELQADAMRAAELASRKEAERLVAETARANLAIQLEDQARAEEPTNPVCLPLPRVLRLNSR
jgi:hypothetical protein